MANDAKFGLIAGLVAVVLVAVVYQQKKPAEPPSARPPASPKKAFPPASATLGPLHSGPREPLLNQPQPPQSTAIQD